MLKVPKKIKNFVWRACKDSIPTKVNLRRRSIAISLLCDRCSIEEENCLHALWSCRELDLVWSASSGWGHRSTSDYVDFRELLSWILENHAQHKLFAITVWTIWNQRNQIRHHVPSCSTDQIAQVALEKLNEFHYVLPQPLPALPQSKVAWKPPPSSIFKLNFDGAIFKSENKSGVGVVIRGCRGHMIASLTPRFFHKHMML
nr:putative ribonuclease h protein [Quercus suber]